MCIRDSNTIVVISIAQYLISKDEHTALDKISQTYNMHISLKKIIYKHNTIFFPHTTYTHTYHTHTHSRAQTNKPHTHTYTHTHQHTYTHKYAGAQREDCNGDERRWGGGGIRKERRQNLKSVVVILFLEASL